MKKLNPISSAMMLRTEIVVESATSESTVKLPMSLPSTLTGTEIRNFAPPGLPSSATQYVFFIFLSSSSLSADIGRSDFEKLRSFTRGFSNPSSVSIIWKT